MNIDDIASDLRRLIAFESVKAEPSDGAPFGRENAAALDFFLQRAAQYGLETKNLDGYAGYTQYGGCGTGDDSNDNCVDVLVHLDVVPATADGWLAPPFSGDIIDGKIYGRGAIDDKGPAAVMLHVLRELRARGTALKKRVRLIAGCDEESGSKCMEHYRKHEKFAPVGFSPDSDFPLINLEKHILHLEISLPAHGLETFVRHMDCGSRPNIVPACAAATLHSGETVCAEGISVHAMEAHKGKNAIFGLVALLRQKTQNASLDFLASALCRDTYGNGLGIACDDGKSGPLTCNFACLRLDGDTLRAVLDLRIPVLCDPDAITASVDSALPAGASVRVLRLERGHYVPEDSDLVKTLLAVYEGATGIKGCAKPTGGGTYARQLACGVAFGPELPDMEANIHAVNEYISLQTLEKLFEIYYEAVVRLCE